MNEKMQYLNVVKSATSEEQKKELLKKGFVPVKSGGAGQRGQKKEQKTQQAEKEQTGDGGENG